MIRGYAIENRQKGNKYLTWLKADCPICRREYEHTPDYVPRTCGSFDCLKKASLRGLLR